MQLNLVLKLALFLEITKKEVVKRYVLALN